MTQKLTSIVVRLPYITTEMMRKSSSTRLITFFVLVPINQILPRLFINVVIQEDLAHI